MKSLLHRLALLLEFLVSLGLLGGIWYGWREVERLQQHIQASQQHIAQEPHVALQHSAQQVELKKFEARLGQLEHMVVPREKVGDVVTRLEGVAREENIRIIVPDIKEVVVIGKDNKPVPSTGRYVDIRLTVKGSGNPADLVSFLYQVEHLPYLLRVPTWRVTTDYSALPAALGVRPPTPEAAAPAPRDGLLEASIILTITREL